MIIPRVIRQQLGSRLRAYDACERLNRLCAAAACKSPGSLTEFTIRAGGPLTRLHVELFVSRNYPSLAIVHATTPIAGCYIGYLAVQPEPGVPSSVPHDRFANTL